MTPEEFKDFVLKRNPVHIFTGGEPTSGVLITFDDGTHIEIKADSQWASADANIFLTFEKTNK